MNIPHYNLQPAQAVPVLRNHPELKWAQLPYRPIDDLPFPLIASVARKLSEDLGTPYDMALHTTLAATAVCTQGVADVLVPGGWESPISAMLLLTAPSAAGKTPLVRQLFHVLDEMEDELLKRKLTDSFDPDDRDRPFINVDDISDAAFFDNVKAVGICNVINTESSKNFNKLEVDAITALNTIHDGDIVRKSRSGPKGYNIKIEGARVTVSFGLQDSVFNNFIKSEKGKYWVASGALNRFIICIPEIDYTRFPQRSVQHDTVELEQFRERQASLLKTSFTPGYERRQVKFDPAACEYWHRMSDSIHSQCAPGMYFQSVAGHAMKLKDTVPRIAAIIHVFEGFEGDISESTLDAAYNIVMHYADYFVALFSPIEQSVLDAIEIDEIITERFRSQHGAYINPEERYIYLEKLKGYLPSKLKKPNRLHDALRELSKMKRIEVYWAGQEGSRSKKQWVDIYPCSQPYPPNWLQLEGGAL